MLATITLPISNMFALYLDFYRSSSLGAIALSAQDALK